MGDEGEDVGDEVGLLEMGVGEGFGVRCVV